MAQDPAAKKKLYFETRVGQYYTGYSDLSPKAIEGGGKNAFYKIGVLPDIADVLKQEMGAVY